MEPNYIPAIISTGGWVPVGGLSRGGHAPFHIIGSCMNMVPCDLFEEALHVSRKPDGYGTAFFFFFFLSPHCKIKYFVYEWK